jgi:hypothetical protein
VRRITTPLGTNITSSAQSTTQQQSQAYLGIQAHNTPQSGGNVSKPPNDRIAKSVDPSTKPGSNTHSNMNTGIQLKQHVFLVASVSEDHRLAHIEVHKLTTTDEFFELLRSKYCRLRGRLRRWVSIWGYSHCDFFKVIQDFSRISLKLTSFTPVCKVPRPRTSSTCSRIS